MTHALLTPEEMYQADALAIAAGIPSLTLMENAGRAVAEEILRRYGARPTLVLSGPGNNGGDGFVVARYLKRWGWPVRLALYGDRARLKGDAAAMAEKWDGPLDDWAGTMKALAATPSIRLSGERRDTELIVDAIFGSGLSKPMPEDIVDALMAADVPIVAVDVPSGLDGATGQARENCAAADLTVTFFRKKPGHLLLPGRLVCGETVVRSIGIPAKVLFDIDPKCWENAAPDLPWRFPETHKYKHGHAVIVSGGPLNTGAARLAATAALKSGAGLVTLSGTREALAVHAAHLTAVMLSDAELATLLSDRRKNAVCIGPAAGLGTETRDKVETVLMSGPPRCSMPMRSPPSPKNRKGCSA